MKAFIVVGLGFGDESKGSVTDYLCRKHKADLVVRYNGGCQCSHNVVTDDGRYHSFSQFGSGTFTGASTYLSQHMLLEPIALEREAGSLALKGIDTPLNHIVIHPNTIITTPWHKWANRAKEHGRGHGSVGLGIGETREDALVHNLKVTVTDVLGGTAFHKLLEIKEHKLEQVSKLDDVSMELQNLAKLPVKFILDHYERILGMVGGFNKGGILNRDAVVFEGGQGVLLDETYGFAPYNTWTNTLPDNAESILAENPNLKVEATTIGVIRSYYTRHGNGPFPSKRGYWDYMVKAEKHNVYHAWMGNFRVGNFDAVMLKYALSLANVDELAVSHLDCIPSRQVVTAYEDAPAGNWPAKLAGSLITGVLEDSGPDLPAWIEDQTGKPVTIRSYGPKASDKREKGEIWTSQTAH